MPQPRITEYKTWEQVVLQCMQEANSSDNGFKQWMKSKESLGVRYFRPGKAWTYCYNVFKKINKTDTDHVEIVVGKEGSGKSTLAIQRACMVDPTFCRERIFNDTLDLVRWLKRNKGKTRGKAIILDEGNLMIFNRESLKAGNINMIKLFALCRQCNLYIIVCIPDFSTIDTYLRRHRVDSLTRITHRHNSFTHYNKKGVVKIDELMRKGMPIGKINIKPENFFNGGWIKDLPQMNDITDKDYRDLKANAWSKFLDDTENLLAETEEGEYFVTLTDATKILPLDRKTLISYIRRGKIQGKQACGKWFVYKPDILATYSQSQARGGK